MIDAPLAHGDCLARRRIVEAPAPVAVLVEVLGHVQRNRFQVGHHRAVDTIHGQRRAQHANGIIAPRRTGDGEPRYIPQGGDGVVVMEVSAEALLVSERGDAHRHRVGELAPGEEPQRAGLAAKLVEGIVQVCEVLDFGDRQQPHEPRSLCHAQNGRLVEQGIEHPPRAEGPVQARRHRVDTALARHILTEYTGLWVGDHEIVERAIDLHGEMPGRLAFRQTIMTAERRGPGFVVRATACLRGNGFGIAVLQRRHHCLAACEPGPGRGAPGGIGDPLPGRLVAFQNGLRRQRARGHRQRRSSQERVPGLVRLDRCGGPVRGLHVGARMAEQAHHVQVEECGHARAPDVLRGLAGHPVRLGHVQAVGLEVADTRAGAEALAYPLRRRRHRDAQAVVLADEQHRAGQMLECRPGGGIEAGQGRGVVHGGIAEAAHREGILGNRQRVVVTPPVLTDGERRAHCLGQVRGDGGGLRHHPHRAGSPDLVATAGDRVLRARGERECRVIHRIDIGELARAFHHERPGAIVEKRRIAGAHGTRHRRVPFMAGAADGVEPLVARTHVPCLEIQMPREHLRIEQLAQRGPGECFRHGLPLPGTDERAETLVHRLHPTRTAAAHLGPCCHHGSSSHTIGMRLSLHSDATETQPARPAHLRNRGKA